MPAPRTPPGARATAGGGVGAGGAPAPPPAARLAVADELEPPVALEVRVLLERRQRHAARHRELELLETDAPRGGRGRALEGPGQLDEGLVALAREHGVRDAAEQGVGVEGGVEPVESDVAGRGHPPPARGERSAAPAAGGG